MDLQVSGMLKMIFVCHIIALVLMLSFLIQCPAREFVGITVGYNQQYVYFVLIIKILNYFFILIYTNNQ